MMRLYFVEVVCQLCCDAHVYNRSKLLDANYETPNNKVKQQQQQPFNGLCSGTTRVGRYQKKHSAFLP